VSPRSTRNLEYIVVDGRVDGRDADPERYRDRLAHCVSGDEGQADALNKGFALARARSWPGSTATTAILPARSARGAAFDAWGRHGRRLRRCKRRGRGGVRALHAAARSRGGASSRACSISTAVDPGLLLPAGGLLDPRDLGEGWRGGVKELYFSMDDRVWLRLAESGGRIVRVPDTAVLTACTPGAEDRGRGPALRSGAATVAGSTAPRARDEGPSAECGWSSPTTPASSSAPAPRTCGRSRACCPGPRGGGALLLSGRGGAAVAFGDAAAAWLGLREFRDLHWEREPKDEVIHARVVEAARGLKPDAVVGEPPRRAGRSPAGRVARRRAPGGGLHARRAVSSWGAVLIPARCRLYETAATRRVPPRRSIPRSSPG
jgi:hypothetical protein